MSATIHQRLFGHASRTPDAPFAIFRDGDGVERTTSFATFAGMCLHYRRWFLQELGVSAGGIIAIMLPQSLEGMAAFVGAMAGGAIPAFFPEPSLKQDPGLFWMSHGAVFDRIAPAVLVVSEDLLETARGHLPRHANIVVAAPSNATEHDLHGSDALASDPDAVAFLQHSSGTTGLKKGVQLSHRAVIAQIEAYGDALAIDANDVIVSWLPLYHDMGLIACFMLPAVLGLPVVTLDPFTWVARPATLLEAANAHRATLTWLPNFAYHHILRTLPDDFSADLSSLRAVIDCSEPCKPLTFALFAERLAPLGLESSALQACYAMAENVFAVTQTRAGSAPRVIRADRAIYEDMHRIRPARGDAIEFLSCGPPIAHVTLSIRGSAAETLPDGHVGEIVIRSDFLFSGYYRSPDHDAALADGAYASGDLGFLTDGELFVTGRIDDLLIVNGKNLYAHDIEQAINTGTDVKAGRVVALGLENPILGSQDLVIVAETADSDPERRRRLSREIRSIVSGTFNASASRVLLVDTGWLIKTTSGKISRKANSEKLAQTAPS